MKQRLAGDSLKLALATAVASVANYGTNAWLAGRLSIDAFGDAALIVSSLLLLSAVAVAIQLAASHRRTTADDDGLRRLTNRVRTTGIVLGVAMLAASGVLAQVLNSDSVLSFAVLGASIPIYLLMSIDRGIMQGELRFGDLGVSMIVEAVTRFGLTVVALAFVDGAAAAAIGMAASFAATRVHARLVARRGEPQRVTAPNPSAAAGASIGVPLVLLLCAQVMIANGDVIVMSAVAPASAGIFAAVALLGRLSFPLAWAIINAAFPKLSDENRLASVVRSTMLAVVGLATVTVIGTWLVGPIAARMLFGADATEVIPWLVPYSIATGAFAVATFGAVIDVARGSSRGAAALLVFGIIQTIVLAIVGRYGVGVAVWVQVAAMGAAAAYALAAHRTLLTTRTRQARPLVGVV